MKLRYITIVLASVCFLCAFNLLTNTQDWKNLSQHHGPWPPHSLIWQETAKPCRKSSFEVDWVCQGWLAVVVHPLPMPLNMFAIVVQSSERSTKSQWDIFCESYSLDIFGSFHVRDLLGNQVPQVPHCHEQIWGCVPSREQLVSGLSALVVFGLESNLEVWKGYTCKRTAPFSSPWLSSWPLLLFRARCMFIICRYWDKLVISLTRVTMEQTVTNSFKLFCTCSSSLDLCHGYIKGVLFFVL